METRCRLLLLLLLLLLMMMMEMVIAQIGKTTHILYTG